MPHRRSPRCRHLTALVAVAVAVAFSTSTAAYAKTAGWSQRKCDVAAVTWARTHPHTVAYKAKYVLYLKQLRALHGCKFAHLP
jgi:hypothetical protein